LREQAKGIWACDFLQLYDAWFRPLFAFFLVEHATRRVVHFGVTRSPWMAGWRSNYGTQRPMAAARSS
jgi:hypothetical protein